MSRYHKSLLIFGREKCKHNFSRYAMSKCYTIVLVRKLKILLQRLMFEEVAPMLSQPQYVSWVGMGVVNPKT